MGNFSIYVKKKFGKRAAVQETRRSRKARIALAVVTLMNIFRFERFKIESF